MSQIITHDWNGYGISQLKESTKIAKYDIPRGYVNATQMCQANGKRWNDYARLKGSQSYWQGLSDDTQIPVSSLIIQVEAYGNGQATWVHPEVATDLAQWVSTPFRIWANRTLTKVISGEAVQSAQAKIDKIDPQSLISQLNLAGDLLEELGINLTIINQLKLDTIGKQLPATKEMVEAGKKLVGSQNPLDSVGLTPTEIGSQLQPPMKPTEVNSALESLGLQHKIERQSSKGKIKHTWQLTDKGNQYGIVQLTTGDKWSGGQIRWFKSVVSLLQVHFDGSYEGE